MNIAKETLDAMRSGNFTRNLPADSYPDIVSLLEQSKDSVHRKYCYWMLADVALLTNSSEIGSYAVQRVAMEKTLKLKTEALEVVIWTSGVEQYDAVLAALENKRLERKALLALGACVGNQAEDPLMDVLRTAQERNDVGSAAAAAISLARMATKEAVSQLPEIFFQLPRKNWFEGVRASLIFAMSRHATEATTELVRGELGNPKISQLGWACLNYLFRHGDLGDAARTSEYLTRLLERYEADIEVLNYSVTHLDFDYQSELAASIAVLSQHATETLSTFMPRIRANWIKLSLADQTHLKAIAEDAFADLELHAVESGRTAVL